MKTMQEIEQFEYTYCVRNLYEDKFPRYFQTLEHAYGYVLRYICPRHNYNGTWVKDYAEVSDDDLFAESLVPSDHMWRDTHSDGDYSWNRFYTFRKGSKPFLVTNNFGAVIPASAFKRIIPAEKSLPAKAIERLDRKAKERKINEARNEFIDSQRIVKKGSADKIKYEMGVYYRNSCNGGWFRENMKINHRTRTTQEKRWNLAHDNEYFEEYGVKSRAARCGYRLPSKWEDPGNATWGPRRSWKHHSKRKKQWKPKGE